MEGNEGPGGNGILSHVIPGLDELLLHFEKAKSKFASSAHLSTCINRAWIKLDKYGPPSV